MEKRLSKWAVWEVLIGSRDDRAMFPPNKFVAICSLPLRATYLIEMKGQSVPRMEKKAIGMAIHAGISNPVVIGAERMNWQDSL